MPATRQQRRNNARGRVQLPNQRPVPDLQWQVEQVFGALVVCSIQTDVSKLLLQGVINLQCDTAPGFPVSATLWSGGINVTMHSAPTFPCRFTLASADPALRSDQGAFLAALNQPMTATTAVPTPLDALPWTVTSTDGNNVVINIPGLDPAQCRVTATTMVAVSSGEHADGVTVSPSAASFHFIAGGLASGQDVRFEDPDLFTSVGVKQGVQPSTQTIP